MAMPNPPGRANYEPNSWEGAEGGPREDPAAGFSSLPGAGGRPQAAAARGQLRRPLQPGPPVLYQSGHRRATAHRRGVHLRAQQVRPGGHPAPDAGRAAQRTHTELRDGSRRARPARDAGCRRARPRAAKRSARLAGAEHPRARSRQLRRTENRRPGDQRRRRRTGRRPAGRPRRTRRPPWRSSRPRPPAPTPATGARSKESSSTGPPRSCSTPLPSSPRPTAPPRWPPARRPATSIPTRTRTASSSPTPAAPRRCWKRPAWAGDTPPDGGFISLDDKPADFITQCRQLRFWDRLRAPAS